MKYFNKNDVNIKLSNSVKINRSLVSKFQKQNNIKRRLVNSFANEKNICDI